MFEEYLKKKGIRTIPISNSERKAGHLNLVVTKRSEIAVGFASATRIASELARHGWHIATFPAEELFLGHGGAHCMTCPVEVG
jgi:N-dimethylarginine dimethylaminohydrolase